MKKKDLLSLKQTIGVIAALLGLASGFLYQRHLAVQLWERNDVSHTFGLYCLVGSGVMWLVFLVVHYCIKPKK